VDELEYQRQRATDYEQAMKAALDALKIVQQCAHDRLADISGDTTTYEDAFRKLGIACGALMFIEQHVASALR